MIAVFGWFCGAIVTLWATAALFVDVRIAWLRVPASFAYLIILAALCWRMRAVWVAFAGFALVLAWWLSLVPSNARNWQPDVAQLPWAEVNGDQVALHNIRNFDYRTETDYVARWEEKTIDLRNITGVDFFLTHWGVPFIAHTMASFSFSDGSHLAMSVEARKEVGEDYSAVRGFFRQFELIFVLADERDLVRVRTNYRKDEMVYLYRTLMTPADARKLFLAYLRWMNENRTRPRWYNALTANCSSGVTAFLAAHNIGGVSRWDWRTLLVGSADEMLYDLGDLASANLPFPVLKQRALINPAAQAADKAPDFSARIRRERPGF